MPSASTPLSLYVHVPFCASRCGYCDFNTYTAKELGDDVRRDTFHEHLIAEIHQAARTLGADHRVDTVFVGGGTPTLLGADALTHLLTEVRNEFDVAPDAEVTTEANPDSVDSQMLEQLRTGGFTRISFGMQSSAPHVLATLERTHPPGASSAAAAAARAAGFPHVNLDLIYGTPGETDDDLERSLDEVLDAGVDHVSAYSLIVEPGTALARRVQRGEVPPPDDDVAADRYERIDDRLTEAGFDWYEVSNWAKPDGQCRHNIAYWRNANWWGVGPGAHSHLHGRRWWNVKHPHTYAGRVSAGLSPQQDEERLTLEQRKLETLMLALRTKQGIARTTVASSDEVIADLQKRGLIESVERREGETLVLTRKGRLLADYVIRTLAA
ncbi:MAG: radical SAM family heme chaperone HemW [Candidatus Nanopelagicales bacterium]